MVQRIAPFVEAASLTNAVLAGEGVEFAVYRTSSATHGDVALRLPK